MRGLFEDFATHQLVPMSTSSDIPFKIDHHIEPPLHPNPLPFKPYVHELSELEHYNAFLELPVIQNPIPTKTQFNVRFLGRRLPQLNIKHWPEEDHIWMYHFNVFNSRFDILNCHSFAGGSSEKTTDLPTQLGEGILDLVGSDRVWGEQNISRFELPYLQKPPKLKSEFTHNLSGIEIEDYGIDDLLNDFEFVTGKSNLQNMYYPPPPSPILRMIQEGDMQTNERVECTQIELPIFEPRTRINSDLNYRMQLKQLEIEPVNENAKVAELFKLSNNELLLSQINYATREMISGKHLVTKSSWA